MYSGRKKLLEVARALNVNPDTMQATTRQIYDTLTNVDATNSSYAFFQNVGSRTFPASNVSTNRFEAQEALSIESLALFRIPNDPPKLPVAYKGNALVNIIIGSQQVIKDLPVKFASTQGTSKEDGDNYGIINFEVPLVIPPLVSFRVDVTNVDALPAAANSSFGCMLYGMGALINFKQSL